MSRVAISEHKAKSIIYSLLGQKYQGLSVSRDNIYKAILSLSSKKQYVVKVDEGIKKRQKNNLLFKDIEKNKIKIYSQKLFKKGFHQLLVEEYISHTQDEEKFLAINRKREGNMIFYSKNGGVDIEGKIRSVKSVIYSSKNLLAISKSIGIDSQILKKLVDGFDNYYFSFLESNPYVLRKGKIIFLDLAIEVDSAAEFVSGETWTREDLITQTSGLAEEELAAKSLAEKSSASFKLNVLNKNGNIFTIFSGGGASIVLADEIFSKGKAGSIVNYAEYSGNPNEEETYLFAKIILSLVRKSKAKEKKIYIAGGVANFTDIRTTFRGVIRALDSESAMLKKQNVKILVRRGGPHQEEGLEMMSDFLKENKIQGKVCGPDVVLTDIII